MGFITGLLSTGLLFALCAPAITELNWMRAQPTSLSFIPFDATTVKVVPSIIFDEVQTFNILNFSFKATLAQIHLAVITLFCATVAPFGGFFAFGLKRALRAESLGLTMARGGVIERIDCVIVTGFFLLIYMKTIVYKTETTVG